MTSTVRSQKVEVAVAAADVLGQTPLWCERSARLWWIDIDRQLHRSFDPATGLCTSSRHDCRFLGSQALTSDGAHMLAQDLSLGIRDCESGPLRRFCDVEQGLDNRLNDGRVDARGRLWIGTMDNELHRANGSLYRVDGDGTVTPMFGDVIVTNGIAFSPDNRILYFTDTRRYCTWCFDFDLDDGVIGNRRLFADHTATSERPDGACVDVDGGLWTAFFSGSRIVRYRPDGQIDTVIPLPATNPTCVCFGGSRLNTLFVTSARKFLDDGQLSREHEAGHLFAIHGISQGLPEHRFAANLCAPN
ncbi:gluconolactonase [Bradyrhizobium sacchari]|uniref:Sugar lactone lactonase YvrE n=1 Tax=Bradyrhizobium sacchari TaxID=1399419 RepID=A0A560JCH8_9BRAD|nr:SMP-30/gluconolactonase/LRE family protein [Bradyrhizobium sacchari]OPY94101.1 gluconolactonase [Bradyrhizobium sacchari]TWB49369.1 sugar lactone lactonase YvrE [Bradyrhizobium sacchari]TWB68199.1 sugar lactone lactonase YvrE [Bradyrhizobium sacchari]